METIYGVNCIKGEVHSLMTLLRWSSRWVGSSSNLPASIDAGNSKHSTIISEFGELSDNIKDVFDLHNLNCCVYLEPFCRLVISQKASGPLTCAALNSLSKFALYGFLSSNFPGAKLGVNMVAYAISNCIFDETDKESDEIILMKLLELATMTFRSDASGLLTVFNAWRMYETCLAIYGQQKSSKVLRSEAESCLRHLTLTTFGGIHDTFLNCSSETSVSNATPTKFSSSFASVADEAKKAYWETAKDVYTMSNPVGMTLFLKKLLTVLAGYLDSRTRAPEFIRLSLSLVNVALEAGGPSLGKLPLIVDILRQDICRYLLVATQSEDMIIFNLALRVVFNLFVSIKEHMKVQLEVFLNSVHIRMLQTTRSDVNTTLHARTEMIIESLLEFANEPLVLQDLYVNYDCDVKCTNLYETIIDVLCSNCLPTKLKTLNILDDIIDDDEFLDELSTASTKPRKAGLTPGSNRPQGSGTSSDAYSVFHRINATESISKDVKLVYSSNKHIWFHHIDGVNKLAVDGVLTVLKSLAGMCYVDAEVGVDENIPHKDVNGVDLKHSKSSDMFSYLQHQEGEDDAVSSSVRSVSSSNVTPPPDTRGDVERSVDLWCSEVEDERVSYSDFDSSTVATHDMYGTVCRNSNTFPVPIGLNGGAFKRAAPGPYKRSVSVTSEAEAGVESGFEVHSKASAEVLKQRKLKKQRLSMVVESFNAKPLKEDWSKLAIKMDLLKGARVNSDGVVSPYSDSGGSNGSTLVDDCTISTTVGDPREVAVFLRQTAGLNKTKIGEFISRGPADVYPYTALVLKEYVATFDFKGSSFDNALRAFLGAFMLPGEAQCIDRLMESFAQKLFEDLGPNNPFATADAAFILSFSTIMLNTDLHNPQIQENKRMKMSDFVRNNSTINNGKDLPLEYVQDLYNNIKNNEIKLDLDASGAHDAEYLLEDMNGWNALISKSTELQAPPVFTPAAAARRSDRGNLNGQRFYPVTHGKIELSSMASSPAPSIANGAVNNSSQIHDNAPVWSAGINIYQKDMFMVLAKPVLNCLLVILERCYLADNYFVKILEGLLDFAKLCEGFKLHSLLDRLLIALYCSIRRISEHRELKESRDKERFAVDHFKIEDLLSRNEFSGMKSVLAFDLVDIIRHSNDRRYHRSCAYSDNYIENDKNITVVDTTPSTPKKQAPAVPVTVLSANYQPVQNNKLKLIGSVHIRSEIMLKLVFYVLSHHASCISGNGWEVIYAVLLWLREKGLLGDSARLSQIYQLGVVFKEHNSMATKLPEDEFASLTFNQVSIYERVCHKCAMGIAIPSYNTEKSSATPVSPGPDGNNSGVFTNLWSAFAGDTTQVGAVVELQYDEIDRYISHYTWNSSVSWYRQNVGGIVSGKASEMADIWNSYCLMKHTMQSYDVIELTYNKQPENEVDKTELQNDEFGTIVPNHVSNSLLKVNDIQVSTVQFTSLLYLVRSMIVELTDEQYATAANTVAFNSSDNLMERDLMHSNTATPSIPESVCRSKLDISKQQLDVAFLLDVCFRVLVSNIYAFVSVVHTDSQQLSSNLLIICEMYRRLISLFDLVLDEHINVFCTHYPYIVERVSVLTLDLAAVVVNSLAQMPCSSGECVSKVGFSSPSKKKRDSSSQNIPSTPTPAAAAVKLPNTSTISEILWYSLALLRNISVTVFGNLSHMFGKGLSCFVVLLSTSSNMLEDLELQNWCILFSLLSLAARIPGVGRQHVWDSICHLLDHNHINAANFTQYRRLLLRYLHGVFPGEGEEDQRQKLLFHGGEPESALNSSVIVHGVDNSFIAPAMIRLAKLTLMALAGESRSRNKQNDDEFETYACPVLSMTYSSDVLAPSGDQARTRSALLKYQNYFRFIASFTCRDEFYHLENGVSSQAIQETLLQTVRLTHIKVKPVFFVSHAAGGADSEVDKLWLETCKMFSEIVLLLINDISEQGLYCIQVLFVAGRKTVAPSAWAAVLTEMISRLPLKLDQFSMNVEPDHEAPGYLSDLVKEQMVSVALHGCSTIFEALIDSFDSVVCSSSLSKSGLLPDSALGYVVQIWSPFISILASNARMLNSDQLSFGGNANITANEEMHDMIGALFKLLLGYTREHKLEVVREHMQMAWAKCAGSTKGTNESFVSKLGGRFPTVVQELHGSMPSRNDSGLSSIVSQLWAPHDLENVPAASCMVVPANAKPPAVPIASKNTPPPAEVEVAPVFSTSDTEQSAARPTNSDNAQLAPESPELPSPSSSSICMEEATEVRSEDIVGVASVVQEPLRDFLGEDTRSPSQRCSPLPTQVIEPVAPPAVLLRAAFGEGDTNDVKMTPGAPMDPVLSISRGSSLALTPAATPVVDGSNNAAPHPIMTPVDSKSPVKCQVNKKINYSKQFTV